MEHFLLLEFCISTDDYRKNTRSPQRSYNCILFGSDRGVAFAMLYVYNVVNNLESGIRLGNI